MLNLGSHNMKITAAIILICAFSSVTYAADIEAGRSKAKTVCVACHGMDGNSSDPTFPKIAGQHSAYLVKSLKAYREGSRVDPTMNPMAASLSDKDIDDLAAYFASQKPSSCR